MGILHAGTQAPHFSLLNQQGNVINLDDFKGKSGVILYFYPKASTPGCTTQACGLRDSNDELAALNYVALGVSPDEPKSLLKFDTKYSLGFTLLADPDHKVAEAYGVWGLKKFMGREFMGILRTTFIIDINGVVNYVIEKVDTKTHNQTVIAYIKGKK